MVRFFEQLHSGPAAVEIVTGYRPHYSTFFRWTQRGIQTGDGRRIRLEFVKAGSKRLTSEAAVRRFFQAVTEGIGGPLASVLPRGANAMSDQSTDDDLLREGF